MDLDTEQRQVVDSNESLMVIAGPGSGKTRVLTEKARKILSEGKSLICLTFTRSAAREMASRVEGLPASTIHSHCCGRIGWKDEWGYSGLLYRFLAQKDIEKFDWVLLDEAQDVNEMEIDVVLSMVGSKIFAVGDPYQSIYGFQGALGPRISSILDRRGCKEVHLHSNYRSSSKIVSRLNTVYDRKLISKGIKDTGLTAVLCRTNDDVFYVSNTLKRFLIPHRLRLATELSDVKERDILEPSNLRIMTCHQSKGLEFDNVYLFSWLPDWSDPEEVRVYYVSIARASKVFKEVSNMDKLLKELDE